MNLQQYFAIYVAAHMSLGVAASPVIGMASARGSIRVNNSAVAGNGTLFEGTTVETTRAASDVKLNSGVRMQLSGGSKGTVFSDRTVLERGESQIQVGGTPYRLEAGALRIEVAESGAAGRVQMASGDRILVSALHGNLRVSSSNGIALASLAAGRALEFDARNAAASAPSRMSGCVSRIDGRTMLTDDTTGVTVEVKGAGVEKLAGHKVEIQGTHLPPAMNSAGGNQTVQVTSVKDVSKKCVSTPAAAAPGGGAASGAAGSGGATGAAAAGAGAAAKAVIAGVVVAAAATGAAIAVTGQDDAVSR